jgi:hypothetical protein
MARLRPPSVRGRNILSRDRASETRVDPPVTGIRWHIGCSADRTHENFFAGVAVAARQLAGHRGFTVIVVVTLALGIGATITCFAVLNAVALKPIRSPSRTVSPGCAWLTAADPAARARRWTRSRRSNKPEGPFRVCRHTSTRAVTVAGAGVAERIQAAEVSGTSSPCWVSRCSGADP